MAITTLSLAPIAGMIATLSLSANPADNDIAVEAATPQPDVIATRDDRYFRMTVPVTFGEKGTYRFMVDTGAQATVITSQLNETLQLRPTGRALIVGMASSAWADTVEIDEMSMGEQTFSGLTAPVLDARHVGADGIVGLDSLQSLRILMNFRENSITLVDANERQSSRGYEIIVRARRKLGQLIITNAVIDGVKAAVIIDTGAQGSMGNLALRGRLRARKSPEVTATDVNGVSITGELRFARRVKIQDLELNNVPIAYADTPAFDALGYADKPALTLGMRHLRMFDRVAIDFKKRQVLFDLPRSAGRGPANPLPFPPGW